MCIRDSIYAGANDAVVAFDPAFIMNYSVKATAIITDVLANHLRSNTSIKNDSTQILKLQAGSYDSVSYTHLDVYKRQALVFLWQ